MGVKKICVFGAGLMGRGIAHVGALGGFEISLRDVEDDILKDALSATEKNLKKGVELGKVKEEEMISALAKIEITTDLNKAVKDADLVIEAVPEVMELKIEVFQELDKLCPKHTILATNTSGLSISEIAFATNRPDLVIGMHFFNPVHLMRLVEIIRGLETSESTYKVAEEVSKRMGKETVEVNESPGFVTTRINALIGNEAFYLLQEGVATAANIDKAIKLGLNHPMGPLELGDLVGLDTRLKVLEYLHKNFGEKYRPNPLLVKYVKAGRLGRKVGKGVYEYTK